MSKPLTPLQSWLLVLATAAGFAVLVLADQLVAGIVLLVAVVMALVARLLWQAVAEGPSKPERVAREEEPPRCCICDGVYDPEKPHGALNVHIERLDRRAWIEVIDAVVIGACCWPSCFRELWDRLEEAFPHASFRFAEESIEAFKRHEG